MQPPGLKTEKGPYHQPNGANGPADWPPQPPASQRLACWRRLAVKTGWQAQIHTKFTMYWGNEFRGPIPSPRPDAQTNPKEHLLGGVGRQGVWGCVVGWGTPHLGVRVRYRANWPANCGVDFFVKFRYGANGHGHQTGQMRLPIGPQAKVGILVPLGKNWVVGANRTGRRLPSINRMMSGPLFLAAPNLCN